jgi:uroporphyrinogen decarboxylase
MGYNESNHKNFLDEEAEILTSRQRVLMTVNHQEPDRVPVDLSGHRASGMAAMAYNRLKKKLGIEGGAIFVYDMVQQLAIIEPAVMDLLGVDTIELGRAFAQEPEYWREWELPDGTPCKIPGFIHPIRSGRDWHIYHADGTLIATQREGCYYFEQTCYPLAERPDHLFENLKKDQEKVMWAALGSPPAPLSYDPEGLQILRKSARRLRTETERAILGLFGGNLLENGQFLFGMQNFMVLLASEPKRVHLFLDKLLEMHLANLEAFALAVGDSIDIIQFNDDFGTQNGPQISLKMYLEFFHPRYQRMWERCRQLTNARIMLHSCGGIYPFLPYLIEAGLEILQPVQTSSRGMEAERLKREYGRDLCFWGGGCETQHILGRGTPAEVAQDVRRRMEIFSPGGGYVFQQIHNIQADVPPENILAMFEAVNP